MGLAAWPVKTNHWSDPPPSQDECGAEVSRLRGLLGAFSGVPGPWVVGGVGSYVGDLGRFLELAPQRPRHVQNPLEVILTALCLWIYSAGHSSRLVILSMVSFSCLSTHSSRIEDGCEPKS